MPRWFVLLFVWLAACGRGESGLVEGRDPRIARVGRFIVGKRGELRFAWPATQLRLRFEGRALSAELQDEPLPDTTRDNDWLALEVDGKPLPKLQLKSGRHRYQLARELAPGPHTLVLTKRTEAEVGTVTVHGFLASAGTRLLDAPPARRRRIEVIGDSISAGYGSEGRGPECGFRAADEDASRTYAALAARTLAAELIVEAWSGKGVARNHDARDREPMPAMYTRILPGLASSPRFGAEYRAQAVVVHLGTNDFWRGPPDGAQFLAAYRALLAELRARQPGAMFVLVLSPMLSDEYPHAGARGRLRGWLTELVNELGAQGVRASMIEQRYAPGEPLGCHAHPSLAAHVRFAGELAALLSRQLGW